MADAGFVQDAILSAMKAEAERIVEQETGKAAAAVRDRLAQVAPQVAMSVFRQLDVASFADRIVITIRNEVSRG